MQIVVKINAIFKSSDLIEEEKLNRAVKEDYLVEKRNESSIDG